MSALKITLLQETLSWMDGEANLRHFDEQLDGLTGRDLILLPEMVYHRLCNGSGEKLAATGAGGGVAASACPSQRCPGRRQCGDSDRNTAR
ncbi:C-N hydrolase family amidase [Pantoea agglomerans]|uniref:C-N hydrolase family amidase n=1 Tax=Enterobacter agglomerans TaxID=549 RepID=A0A379AK11_ENTAG|nr:C-N hydrolase family amidase [Pantoea agglomerans]